MTKQNNKGQASQEVKETIPEAVQEIDGYYTVAYGNLLGVVINSKKN